MTIEKPRNKIAHGNKYNTQREQEAGATVAKETCLVQCPHCGWVYTTNFKREKIRKNIKLGAKKCALKTVCKNPAGCAPKTRGITNAQRKKEASNKKGIENSQFNANSMQNCHIWACVDIRTRSKVRTLQSIAEACNIGLTKATRGEAIRLHRIETNTPNSTGCPYPFKRWNRLLDGE